MKKTYLITICALLLLGCQKELHQAPETGQFSKTNYIAQVQQALKDSLSASDYASLDFTRSLTSGIDSLNIHLLRIPLLGKTIADDFLLIKTDPAGHLLKGRFISVARDTARKATFNGSIAFRPLHGTAMKSFTVSNGHINRAYAYSVDMMEEEPVMEGGDLPDVVVVSYIYDGGISYADWYNLLDMVGDGGSGSSYGCYSPSDGGGGSGTGSETTMQVDFESPESKDAINLKSYLNCFGTTFSASADYTMTISVDLPVDNDPSKFFNWSDASPGHTFITLYENNGGNLVQQNFGFYPNSSWKTVVGPDNLVSKMVDDAGHEYQARYTVTLSATQFQQALQAAKNYSSNSYNVASFNCADYALAVFNSAGGSLAVPKFQIPGFPSANGSNTPEGVYDAIQSLEISGNPNAIANRQKQWTGDSHGACD